MDQHPNKGNKTPEKYDRILDNLIDKLDDSGLKSWDFIEHQLQEAVATEQAAEELTKDEAQLLLAYLRRDIQSLGYTLHEVGASLAQWLKFDLDYLEKVVSERLLAVADRSRVDYELLREQLDHGEAQYMAGEVTVAGTLVCMNCSTEQTLRETTAISPCEVCQGLVFERPLPTRVD
jgi:hypothetical protein